MHCSLPGTPTAQSPHSVTPLNLPPGKELGIALQAAGDSVDAIASFQRGAVALDPRDAAFHHSLATALHQTGDVDSAVASFRHAIELHAGYAEAHHGLALSLYDARCTHRDINSSITSLRRAIEN